MLLSVTPTTDSTAIDWTQLGVSSVVVALLLLVVRYLLAQNAKKDEELKALHKTCSDLQQARIDDRDSQLERDRERSERVVALLTQTATVLEAAPRQFERALGTARDATTRQETDDTTRQVRQMIADLERRLDPP